MKEKETITEDTSQFMRRRRIQFSFHLNNNLSDSLDDDTNNNARISNDGFVSTSCQSLILFFIMHKNARIGLIGLFVALFFVVLILVLTLGKSKPPEPTCVHPDGRQTCYVENQNPYRNFGTKTAYHVVLEDYKKSVDLEGCTPKVFYLLSRHATRYPDQEYIEYINKYLPELKERIVNSYENGTVRLCKGDVDKLKNWQPTMKSIDQNKLSLTGALEATELGERMKERFSALLNMSYSAKKFIIEYTSRERTKHTAQNFARGLFTDEDYKKIDFNEKKENDKVLQFHKQCKKLRKECEDTDYNISEVEKFENGSLMRKVVSSVSKRIGFYVSYEDVKHMHVACTFGYALNISDAWCAVFSTEELKVLEFHDDIDDYYKDAYGNEVNYKQACPVVQYIVDLFKSYENDKTNKVVLHFSHAGGMKKVYAAFGLFRDDKPLTADNFCALNNRKWKTSFICPFNSNIAFVLHECNGDLKFIVLHNEKPVIIEGCDNKLCSLKEFIDKYEPIAENCDLKEICNTCKIK